MWLHCWLVQNSHKPQKNRQQYFVDACEGTGGGVPPAWRQPKGGQLAPNPTKGTVTWVLSKLGCPSLRTFWNSLAASSHWEGLKKHRCLCTSKQHPFKECAGLGVLTREYEAVCRGPARNWMNICMNLIKYSPALLRVFHYRTDRNNVGQSYSKA